MAELDLNLGWTPKLMPILLNAPFSLEFTKGLKSRTALFTPERLDILKTLESQDSFDGSMKVEGNAFPKCQTSPQT